MYYFWTAVLGTIAFLWIVQGLRMVVGMSKVPWLGRAAPLPDARYPSVSLLVAARDEAAHLPIALPTQLAQDYPRYEVIAVDDRSSDATSQILEEFARHHHNLKVIHVAQLPQGWLGKPHALSVAFEHAKGDWLVFADADVQFAPDLLRRAVALVEEKRWDHLTVLPHLDLVGFWEKAAVSYWVLGFTLAFEPWRVSDPRSPRYLGVGAFQLVRRSAYEAVGTHRRLAMEIADDTKLGKLVKQGGFRSGVAVSAEKVRLRWQVGLGNMIRGLTKNFFAACGFRVRTVAAKFLRICAFSLLPFVAVVFTSGTPRVLATVSIVAALMSHTWATEHLYLSPLIALTHPLGAVIFCYIFFRSTFITLRRGGVVWRGTFYPLGDLRRGIV